MTPLEFLTIIVLCTHGVLSQNWLQGLAARSGIGRPRSQSATRYLTCIGQTANNDQLRVTFSNNNQNRFTREIRVQANIQAGVSSQISGNFQLVVTNDGRIDGMCDPAALGAILSLSSTNTRQPMMNIWNNMAQRTQNSQNRRTAKIGSVFQLRAGQSVSMADILTGVSYSRLAGSGMAICSQIVGNRCVGNYLPLCCTISKDSKTAAQTLSRGMVGGTGINNFGGIGHQNFGTNAINGVMNGINPGIQGGMTNNIPTGGQGGLVFP